jgi:hypothetical protein
MHAGDAHGQAAAAAARAGQTGNARRLCTSALHSQSQLLQHDDVVLVVKPHPQLREHLLQVVDVPYTQQQLLPYVLSGRVQQQPAGSGHGGGR